MLTQVAINRAARDGSYGDVLDVLESLSSVYGSAVNAAVQIIQKSTEFKDTLADLRKGDKPRRPKAVV